MYFHVCETQRTRMHVTDTTETPNGHQMAVVTWDRSIVSLEVGSLACHQVILGVDLAKQTHVVNIKGDLELIILI